MSTRIAAGFFDIGGTLGDPVLSGSPPQLKRLDVYADTIQVLERLRKVSVRLGIISNIGEVNAANIAAVKSALTDAKLLTYFDESLFVFGEKDSTKIFKEATLRAGLSSSPESCVFAGEDEEERGFASEAGMQVADRPSSAVKLVEDSIA